MEILRVEKLYKKYNNTNVLDDFSLSIEVGDFIAIMGRSGAGKTTLLNSISGIAKIDRGNIFLKNVDITNYDENMMTSLRRKNFSFILQEPNLIDNLTAYENVMVASDFIDTKKIDEIFVELNIESIKNNMAIDLSGGEAERVSIARAIIKEPDIIFADEPTGALNKAEGEKVLQIFQKLNEKNYTILMVTHDISAASYAKKVLYIEDGKIVDKIDFMVDEKCDKIKILEDMLNKHYW